MTGVDKKQQHAINIALVGIGLITALVGVMAYLDNQKHQKVQQDLFNLDTQIKQIELALKKDEAQKKGVI